MEFSSNDLARLLALAETALPVGRLLPAADATTVQRLCALLASFSPEVRDGYRRLLLALDAEAWVSAGRPFLKLSPQQRLVVLERLDGRELTRLLVRGLLTPLKLAYFDDPRVYEQLGCRYHLERPAALERARWRSQLVDASTLGAGDDLECDVVIVGTGAGGAPLAHALAERGHAVLLLEEGAHHTRLDFNGRPVEMMQRMYRNSGATVALGNTAIPIPVGRGVGGTTLINSGTCFRVPEKVLQSWRQEGLTGFGSNTLAPHYAAAEAMLQVGPSSAAALGRPAELIAEACDKLGYSHHPLQRNAPGCDGQGLCCFGCPTDAKQSTNVSYVPAALAAGAMCVTGFRVDEVLTQNHRAIGVIGEAAGRRIRVSARVVVLACGTLMTPTLLLKNGLANRSGELGRNLSIHPASAALGLFGERIDPSRTVPQGYAIDHFTNEGLYFEGGTVPPDLTAGSISGFGPAYMELMEQFDRTFNFGFMVKDCSRGSVGLAPDGGPRIRYWLNRADLAQVRRGFAILSRVFFAAGAREVHLPVWGFPRLQSLADVDRLERADIAARHVDLSAYHPLGTARMGVDPFKSVVDADHEAHDVHNLYICDGSAVPSSLGVNPMMTIIAMSLRASEGVHRRLERLSARASRRGAA